MRDRYNELKNIFKRLRKECPWDRKQTHRSLVKYLREETGEFIEEVRRNDERGMEEELGDILLQVFFHAQIASETGRFDIDDVFDTLIRKLKRRHPHVFGATRVRSVRDVIVNWDRIKAKEKQHARGKNPRS